MTHTEITREKVRRLMNARPFRRFILVMENGQEIPVEHPENIAIDVGTPRRPEGSNWFSVATDDGYVEGTFTKVTTVLQPDPDNLAG